MTREETIDYLAEKLMVARGFPVGESPLEWNKDDKDSQISMIMEDVEVVYDNLVEMGLDPSPELISMTGGLGNYYNMYKDYVPVPQLPPVTTSVMIQHTLNTNATIGHLKEWMERVELLNLDDDTVIDGYLSVYIDICDSVVTASTHTDGPTTLQEYTITADTLNDD